MSLVGSEKKEAAALGDDKVCELSKATIALRSDSRIGSKVVAVTGDADRPLTKEEIEEYSRIKCQLCGEYVAPEDVTAHSRRCVLEPAPNLRLQLDKWVIASANMIPGDLRTFMNMRRTEELARVEQLEKSLTNRMTQLWWMSGKFGFVMSAKWLREWRSFVGVGRQVAETKDRPPPPINNNDLFGLDGCLSVGLREGVQLDYILLEQPVWEFYSQVYGGGPAILRYNPTSGVMPSISDAVATFEGDWRDLRPDTGHGLVYDPYNGFGFEGEIRDGFLWSGRGKGLLRNGSHYEGEVARGLPDGTGREVWPDGTVLDGHFSKGKLHGFARQTDPQGRVMEGEWEQGELFGI
jgi:hypothetical protein